MTLRELRAAHPALFHPNQDWFEGEAFMDLTPRNIGLPWDCATLSEVPPSRAQGTTADLAALYLDDPSHPMWSHYLWTCDHDQHGQRVYVGVNDGRFEIHRHLALTSRWRTPRWT